MVVTTAGALRLLPKIEKGLRTERARLGTFRGFGTERARLGTFRGFGTERVRLGTFNQKFEIFIQNEHLPSRRFFFLSFGRKSKNRPTCFNFEKKNPDPQLHQIFKPIRKFFFTFLSHINLI